MKKVNFEEVLEKLEQSEVPKSKPEFKVPTIQKFEGFFRLVEQSIQELENGTSTLRKGGVYFPKGNCVPLIWLERFKKTPSIKALSTIISMSEQDLGNGAMEQYLSRLEEISPGIS